MRHLPSLSNSQWEPPTGGDTRDKRPDDDVTGIRERYIYIVHRVVCRFICVVGYVELEALRPCDNLKASTVVPPQTRLVADSDNPVGLHIGHFLCELADRVLEV